MTSPDEAKLQIIGQSMVAAAPHDWTGVILKVSAVSGMTSTNLYVEIGGDKLDTTRSIDRSGMAACRELRDSMYQPDKGTWYRAQFTLTAAGELHAEFDYDSMPFDERDDDDLALFEHDQKKYPRSTENLPLWHPSRKS